jgi:putative transposase
MKPYIERVFRTMAVKLMPRLTGRTFSNVIEKGDHEPEKRAVLNAEDFCAAMVRWIVDIYHRTPHDGIDDETPANCWNRLVSEVGVQAPPNLRRRRLVFGEEDTRVVSTEGITVLGVRYQSRQLAEWFVHAHDRSVRIRWYPEDIGAIAVELDGRWIEVPAMFDGVAGLSAQKWLCAARSLRASHRQAAELDRHIVRKAIEDIEALNGAAMRRMGVLVENWSPKRIAQEEEQLFIGFPTFDTEGEPSEVPEAGEWGIELSTAGPQPAAEPRDSTEAEASEEPASSEDAPEPRPNCQGAPDRKDPGDGGVTWSMEDK